MRDKFRVISLVFLVAACVLLVIGMATRWYYVTSSDSAATIETTYSFYGPRIVVDEFSITMKKKYSLSYGDLGLDKTHNYFNSCLAMCAIAFIIGFVAVILTILNILNVIPDKTWIISRILMIFVLILNFIGVVVAAGFTQGFKNDNFVICRGEGSCQNKWRGTYYGLTTTKFGGGTGFYLCMVAIFPSVGAAATAIASFIIGRNTPKE
ncbi:hypothetical protein DICPUDRAFT_74424 [Dictyostelium purpureum]|uniref:MARVEL domain-containing protein n=1 Tax=Dictyostelium purpureum TaxID=5786 RepID=F0Z7P8_DICPU|nr:uncharacterized protein DICPUDRAFT_74424 [Dictyostelium purpureum]EGC40052.1 hypothetical protein DICPUDRAFT_74424 [Dictyostelium purpureum]|eukprot:XP_003283401.1 hypothetical protein DICPUDRAFT_74424 [Dictyostelium purpureum]